MKLSTNLEGLQRLAPNESSPAATNQIQSGLIGYADPRLLDSERLEDEQFGSEMKEHEDNLKIVKAQKNKLDSIGDAQDIHDYKTKLQQFALRAGLGLPIYNIRVEGKLHALVFKCSVTVDDETYESPRPFSQKKAAEQYIAKHALECIMEKKQEIGASIISKNTTLCKAVLNEYAAKLQIDRPIYNTEKIQQVPLPVFISKMVFRGVSYVGGPARTKKDAEQLLAHHATFSILGFSKEESTLLEIVLSKAGLFSATQLPINPSCAIKPKETIQKEESEATAKSSPRQIEGLPNPSFQIPVQTDATEQCKVTSPSPVVCALASSSEHQGNISQMLPGYQTDCALPQEVSAAAVPSQECSVVCALESAKRLSRNQKKKANKRKRAMLDKLF